MSRFVQTPLKYLVQARITNGVGLPAEHVNPEWPRYIRTTDVSGPRTLREDVWFSQPPELVRKAGVRKWDLLLTNAGMTIGKAYLHVDDAPAVYAGYLTRVRPDTRKVDPRFLSYYTESTPYWDQINVGATRSTIDNFSSGKYQDMIVPIPPLEVQQQVADFLDLQCRYFVDLIDRSTTTVALLREREAAEVHSAVGNAGLSISGPDEVCRLRWFGCEIRTGPFGSQLHAGDYVLDGHPVINPSSIQDGRLVPDPNATIDDATRQRLTQHVFREGDVVFGRRGEMGRSALVGPDEAGWVCGTGCLVVRPRCDRLHPPYLHELLRSDGVQAWLEMMAVGTTMSNLNEEILGSLPIPSITLGEQKERFERIRRIRSEHDAVVATFQRQIDLINERRQALITAAVTGELEL